LVLALSAANASAQFCPLGETERRIVTCKTDVSMEDCKAEAQKVGCTVARVLPLVHAVVIEIPSNRMFIAEAKLANMVKVERVDSDRKVAWLSNLPDTGFSGIDVNELTRRIKETAPKFPSPSAAAPQIPWGVARVGAPAEWARTQGDGAAVAVIDTGIDAAHPDLQGQVLGGVNIVDPAHPDAWQDDEGHGTHVSGTIAGKGLNGGVAGVAPRAKLYAVKVLDKDGNGNYSDVIAGIEWAMNHNIKIANMSLGADEGSEPLHRAVQAALAKGMTIVAAAGNSGGAVGYPGAYPETIAVGASDSADHPANFSAHGPEVAFIAPGVEILSTKMGGGYVSLSGTSMASPHVAGLAALAFSLGATTPSALRAALDGAARPISGLTPDFEGRGMVLAGDLSPRRGLMDGGATLAMAR
ncbi:MAG: S8 family peptidase, partial [Elusimicrobia bacterium]|nr:S8 family peptidase [Elusimicrobiota bacterium]